MIHRGRSLLALAGLALVLAGYQSQEPGQEPQIGAPAPGFSLQSSDGKSVSLADFKDKFVVLEWTNQGCPFVRKQYDSGNMQATQKWAKEKGVVWLSIVSSAPGKQGYLDESQAKEYVKNPALAISALLLDPEGTVGRQYGARTTPHMFIIDPKGTLVYKGAIDDKPSTDPADVKTAKNYVKAALEEALAGKSVTTPSTKPYGCSVKYKD